jgi:hypothetical protein
MDCLLQFLAEIGKGTIALAVTLFIFFVVLDR